jgi:ketosteroid isomerase-like protein
VTFEESVALVRRFTGSWANHDGQSLLDCAHEDMEFDWSESRGPFQGTYVGHAGLKRLLEEQWDAWDEFSIELERIVECGSGRLMTVNLVQARGRGSGVATGSRGAMLWTVRDGKILWAKLFQDEEQALADC